jgi:hypothetical protein
VQYKQGAHIIRRIAQQWKQWILLAWLLWAIAISLPLIALLYKTANVSLYWMALVLPACYITLLLIRNPAKITAEETTRFLDKTEPTLEESSGLLLHPSTGMLENLQAEKISAQLQQLAIPKPWLPALRKALLALGISVLITVLFAQLVTSSYIITSDQHNTQTAEIKPGGIASAKISITPPAYTRKVSRIQQSFNITAEEGSTVQWNIQTAYPAKQLYLLFNDSVRIAMQPGKEKKQWSLARQVVQTGFYQLVIDSLASELYRIDMIADMSPVITIQKPAPNTVIDYGMPRKTLLQATVSDDYGVQDAWIAATIASGSGEGVQFREEQLRFPGTFAGKAQQYPLRQTIDLQALKMVPGDELYFYILAKDNAGHEKRSDIFIITIVDTAELMSLNGLQLGVNVKPDYFRSQRQIIIETEQLLREKDTISVQRFRDRSNNLGIDQKLLRMRYGKFLGEENELDGEEHASETENDAGDFGNADKIIDQFTHKHDIAEDATFFSSDTKAQLKATLSEMWNAELRLRTFQPREALVYEYRALRMLKELQQKDRVYVAKTSVKTTPLNPEKRLSADISKVQEPRLQKTLTLPSEEITQLRKAIAELETLKVGKVPVFSPDMHTAYKYISDAAVRAPSDYLAALSSFKRIQEASGRQKNVLKDDVRQVQQALQKLVQAPLPLPYHPGNSLQRIGQDYFHQLQQMRQ